MNAAVLAAGTVLVAGVALRSGLAPRRPVGTWPDAVARPPAGTPRRSTPGAPPRARPVGAVARRGHGPEQVATWCDELGRRVRSGSTLTAAVREAAPPRAELATLHLALERGAPLAGALAHVGTADPDLQLALTVLRACAEQGGPPGEPIDRAAATLRARAADLAERRTHSAQARLSAIVMTWLPIVMLAMLLLTSASVRAVVTRPLGLLVLTLGATLNVAGWRWMGRIIGGPR